MSFRMFWTILVLVLTIFWIVCLRACKGQRMTPVSPSIKITAQPFPECATKRDRAFYEGFTAEFGSSLVELTPLKELSALWQIEVAIPCGPGADIIQIVIMKNGWLYDELLVRLPSRGNLSSPRDAAREKAWQIHRMITGRGERYRPRRKRNPPLRAASPPGQPLLNLPLLLTTYYCLNPH